MLMTVIDLEKDSQISRHTWRVWIRLGKVPTVRLGRCVRVDENTYRKFLAEHVQEQNSNAALSIRQQK
jgi:predicted site-specific integrase-resolvase